MPRRLPTLTGLRFVAAALVVAFHASSLLARAAPRWSFGFLSLGPAGVSFFFVLSGFVLAWSHLAGPAPERPLATTFWWRRLARLYPAYLVATAVSVVVALRWDSVASVPDGALQALLLTSWLPEHGVQQSNNGALWSLSTEAFFYVVFPFLVVPVLRAARRNAAAILAAVVGLRLLLDVTLHPRIPGTVAYWFLYYFPPVRLLEFVAGIALALAVRERRLPAVPLGVAAAVWALAASQAARVGAPFNLATLTLVPTLLVIVAAAQADIARRWNLLTTPAAQALGDASYALYLVHIPALVFVVNLAPRSWRATGSGGLLVAAIAGAVALAAAFLLHLRVERPAERALAGRHRPPARATPAADLPAAPAWWARRRSGAVRLVALAVGVRAALVAGTLLAPLGSDARDYDRIARSIAAGAGLGPSHLTAGGGPSAFRTPGYPAFLALVYKVADGSIAAARFAGAALGGVTVALLYLLARRLFGRRVALIAAALAAFHPALILDSTALMSESVFLPLVPGTLLLALEARARSGRARAWFAVAAGLAGGAAVLVRPVGIVLLAGAVLLVLPGTSIRAALRPAAAIAGAAALVVLPWTVRNMATFDTFVPLSTLDGLNLAGAYNDVSMRSPWPYTDSFRPPNHVPELRGLFADPSLDEAELSRAAEDAALEHIAEHPWAPLRAIATNSVRMSELAGRGFTVRAVGESLGYGAVPATLAWLAFFPVTALAGYAVVRGRWRAAPLGLWLVPVVLWFGTTVVLGHTRLRAPVDLFLVLLAALALRDVGRRPAPEPVAVAVPVEAPSPVPVPVTAPTARRPDRPPAPTGRSTASRPARRDRPLRSPARPPR